MNWIHIRTELLRSPEFVRAKAGAVETWLRALAHCCEQENGGRIVGGKGWSELGILRALGATFAEIDAAAPLIRFEGEDLIVFGYPSDKEAEVRCKREAGRKGGKISKRPKGGNSHEMDPNDLSLSANVSSPMNTADNGKERKAIESGMEGNPDEKGILPAADAPAKPSAPSGCSESGQKFAKWFRSKLPADQQLPGNWQRNWGECYDDMLRLDNRTREQVFAVCTWAREDDFWAKNFLSPLKLRKRNEAGTMYFDVFTEARSAATNRKRSYAERKRESEYATDPSSPALESMIDD